MRPIILVLSAIAFGVVAPETLAGIALTFLGCIGGIILFYAALDHIDTRRQARAITKMVQAFDKANNPDELKAIREAYREKLSQHYRG